jgi:integrase/recombinase XerD
MRVTIDRSAPCILTVEQSRQLLSSVPPRCKPYLILGMFAGVRSDEIVRMKWSDINFETNTVRVDGKTRRRRIVPLEPIAAELLKACPRESESVTPSRSTVRRWKRKAGKSYLGGRWRQDILRHTAASYLITKYQDVGKVAFWLGNSPQIIMTHYHEPVAQNECEKFWSLGNLN